MATKKISIPVALPQPPFGAEAANLGPKVQAVEVGMFRLPGVKVDLEQFSQEQVEEMRSWAKENGAYSDLDNGLFSWKDPGKRDWFILRWT